MLALAMPCRQKGTRAEARNKEIRRCLTMNPSMILMLDDDQTMPIRGLSALIATGADLAVIDTPNKGFEDSNIRRHPNGELHTVTISCCLIRPEIFQIIDEPWFSSEYALVEEGVKEGRIVTKLVKKYQDDNFGEDVYFVKKVMDAGFKVKVVPGL